MLILEILANSENYNEQNQTHNPETTIVNDIVYVVLDSVIRYGAI